MILFGIRSPLVVEFEETCARLDLTISATVSVEDPARVQDRSKLVSVDEFDPAAFTDPFLSAAFAPNRRRSLIERGESMGLNLATALVDPTAILPRSVRIGDGSFVNAGAIIGGMCLIGRGALINRAVSIGHHTVLGDFVSIGPGATLASNIQVGEGTVIGAGATVLPNVKIGAGSVISAGSVVRKSVPDGMLVSGNPASLRSRVTSRSTLNRHDEE